ncbi:MAG: hypothetical protein IPO40_16920 [Fibrobacteres bacterium]|nr:hypothetical protein [Fibrobacterota bacterium]
MNSIRRVLSAIPYLVVSTALCLAIACSWDNKSGGGSGSLLQEGGDDMGNFLQARMVDSMGRPFAGTGTILSDRDTFLFHADTNGAFRIPAKRRSWVRLVTSRGKFLWDAPPESGDAGIWKVGRSFILRGWFPSRGVISIAGVGEAIHDSGEFVFPEVPPGRAKLTVSTGSKSGSVLIKMAHRVWNVPAPVVDTLVVLPVLVLQDTALRTAPPQDPTACDSSCREFYVRNQGHMIDTTFLSAKSVSAIAPVVATTTCRPWVDSSSIPWNDTIAYDTLCDERDGQTYRIVLFGDKVWMAQNLNYAGRADSAIGHCNSDDPANCKVYGRLYDWATAMGIDQSYNSAHWPDDRTVNRGICPDGWHLPSFGELDTLWTWITSEVGQGNQASALRSASGWRVHESGVPKNGTDRFGMRILPAGFNVGSTYNPPGNDANLFGGTEDQTDPVRARGLDVSNLELLRPGSPAKGVEFSVRCVLD